MKIMENPQKTLFLKYFWHKKSFMLTCIGKMPSKSVNTGEKPCMNSQTKSSVSLALYVDLFYNAHALVYQQIISEV